MKSLTESLMDDPKMLSPFFFSLNRYLRDWSIMSVVHTPSPHPYQRRRPYNPLWQRTWNNSNSFQDNLHDDAERQRWEQGAPPPSPRKKKGVESSIMLRLIHKAEWLAQYLVLAAFMTWRLQTRSNTCWICCAGRMFKSDAIPLFLLAHVGLVSKPVIMHS